MYVISKRVWKEALSADPTLEAPLRSWDKVPSKSHWSSIVDVRKAYPQADFVDPYTVFNIKGGAYRLIVKIEYRWQMIFVKHLLTHAVCKRGGWRK